MNIQISAAGEASKLAPENLLAELPHLLPIAIAWVEQQAAQGAAIGRPLSADEIPLARQMGVVDVDRVRIVVGDHLPVPDDAALRQAAIRSDLMGPGRLGLTLGHTVFIRRNFESLQLLAHELRHVHQYETYGSIARFLPEYLRQIATVGYDNAPLEIDARDHGHTASCLTA